MTTHHLTPATETAPDATTSVPRPTPCPACHGAGILPDTCDDCPTTAWHRCQECKGTGDAS